MEKNERVTRALSPFEKFREHLLVAKEQVRVAERVWKRIDVLCEQDEVDQMMEEEKGKEGINQKSLIDRRPCHCVSLRCI
jgi:pheromone shutdown protein TraB